MNWIRALLTMLTLALCAPVFAQPSVSLAAGSGASPEVGVAIAPALAESELARPRSQPESKPASDDRCTFGALCFGPMVTLGAIDPIGVGAHLRYGPYLGFGIDYQFLPTSIDIDDASATWSLFTVEGRVYPFANAFFVSGGFGYQSFSATVHQVTPAGEVGLSGSLGMPAIKIGIGLMGESGFVLGADIGFNFLLGGADVQFDEPTGPGASYQTGAIGLRAEINDIADQAIDTIPVIPQLNLIRMGYLF